MSQERLGHIIPAKVLIAIWFALVLLAGASFWSYLADLGGLEVLATLGVACAKAALVFFFFMHLGYEGWAEKALFLLLVFVLLLVFGMTLLDVAFR
jgi:cytochrome c oxidase subunit 4